MSMFCDQDVFVANKLLRKPRTPLKIAKQEHLRKILERSRAIWLNMILLLTKRKYTRELFTKARVPVCVLECLCVWCGWWANEGAHPYL